MRLEEEETDGAAGPGPSQATASAAGAGHAGSRPGSRQPHAALLVGLSLALLGSWRPWAGRARSGGPGEDRAPALWVADRDRGALLGLDRDLFVREAVPWAAPLRLAAAGGGRLWVASAPEGWPGGPHRLSLVAPDRPPEDAELLALELEPIIELATWGLGACWLQRSGRGVLLGRVGADGGPGARVRAPPGSQTLAASRSALLVGTDSGQLWRFEGRWRPGPRLGVECLDLEWADTGWWVLARDAGAGQLLLAWLEATCGEPSCPESGCHLVARAGPWRLPGRRAVLVAGASPDCIWVAGARRALGFGSCPRPELPLYQQAVTGGTALRDGGVAFLTPGALIRKGPAGEPLPGQGGFGWLADAVRP